MTNDDSIQKKKIGIFIMFRWEKRLSRRYDYFNKELIDWYC